jgi:hypothetical protein
MINLPPGSPLWPFQPQMRYHLIDQSRYAVEDLKTIGTLAADLFWLEQSRDQADLHELMGALMQRLRQTPDGTLIWTLFAGILQARAHKHGYTGSIPKDLQEARMTLDTVFESVKLEGRQEGIQEGILAGRQEGILAGRQEGILAGRQEGRQEGMQAGRQEGEATMLCRQLTRRFRPLSEEERARIMTATSDQLEDWGLRVFDASSIEEVLDGLPPSLH